MKILVLEDESLRIAKFVTLFGNSHDLTICTTVEAFKSSYLASDIDVVFLDHDLGGKAFVNSDDSNTGYQAAVFMNSIASSNRPKNVIIHSWNMSAVPRMVMAMSDLTAAGTILTCAQFGTFDANLYCTKE